MRTLNEVKIGETVKVLKINGEGVLRRKIMDMGITKGAVISVNNVAPLGDPIEITIRGYDLTIRKLEASIIDVSDDIGEAEA